MNDPAVLGPPIVEFAPFGRVPASKPRKDARQGSIDQDPEFIDFLESLTNPISKPAPFDSSADQENKTGPETVTPLVQYLRDKKANKGKEAASGKGSKQGRLDAKETKGAAVPEKKVVAKPKDVASPEKKSAAAIKVEKAARDAVKVLSKQAATLTKSTSPTVSASAQTQAQTAAPPAASASPAPRERPRGNASAAARILQRDLGLTPGGSRRRRDVPTGTTATTTMTGAASPAQQPAAGTPIATTTAAAPISVPKTISQPPTGPATLRTTPQPAVQPPSTTTPTPTPALQPPPTKIVPSVTPGATQAFLKHANPSQGITESLLESAFASFGGITKVEIDKKKGFAYIDFATAEGLLSAVKAGSVKVAQGSVVILERKTGNALQGRNQSRAGAPVGTGRGSSPAGAGRGGRVAAARGRGGRGAAAAAAAAAAKNSVTGNKSTAEGEGAAQNAGSVQSAQAPGGASAEAAGPSGAGT